MPVSGYKLSQAAQDDLREIKRFSQMNWGKQQTQNYLSDTQTRLKSLTATPEIGKKRDAILPGLRSLSVGNHVIFYRIGDSSIEIARILHKRMDVEIHLGEAP